MAGAVALPPDGPYWQAMRLSRNRQWGLPILVDFLQTLARDAAAQDGWPGLLVGDMAQPRGGPMLTGHASHQVGLDADIWLTPMPVARLTEREREDISATVITEPGPARGLRGPLDAAAHGRLIRRAALDPRVERIFVAPGIKKKLCETVGERPRLAQQGAALLRAQLSFPCAALLPAGHAAAGRSRRRRPATAAARTSTSGSPTSPTSPAPEPPPPKPMMLADLPPACRTVARRRGRSRAR